ncbi:hypothetical protein A3H10_00930 [Candidatus Uhrbacteria bacterium RIFCSPLOWO2_12_FULL_46_10]|uniref:Cell shape determination protein CcmA n=1 Tax=Candidatus Uhrbacteria bacterium RIFCSPLOWO2_01_FULL_47_25 TaxID=1802402 RepID=A0A1F7US25_9BACT|nr:MAG: hypothetical protein UX68_C0010G0062 [Parcubacteria group bacterium GW2011_GWA2_46_9]OGL59270.1 MAG: hypothetical protein A2752_01195 [Candidatus Uhrbacteria bacterium RIFCSPHIGHO2_01_FULL_46_23]OGL68485.1 MAG: hypothetical protein A3D60_02620 [Candidatus Uhrbacteria bacterium RIFCSPHIGHO2_02_FULL_47_29]OGL75588.1 MAG: hypothetical protein A3E96_00915 [Candidatus Uhrbacteria bacterium RIFCSPHIGHO2_12_FULL_46_13]OGL81103.1 MAG: hypothetical protein A2936_00680 [Candidatus Uhrbacteria bac
MFNKNQGAFEGATVIAEGVHVEGNFVGEGSMLICGAVQGTITTNQNLTIGKSAQIDANVKAESVVVSGHVKGNIAAKDRLELTPGSRVDGDVITKTLVVAEGAILNGKCTMGGIESGGIKPVNPKDNNGIKRPPV